MKAAAVTIALMVAAATGGAMAEKHLGAGCTVLILQTIGQP